MGAEQRRRGANAERAVVNYLRANGYEHARRYLAGDGRQPGDVDFHPLVCLEVKDRVESSWPSWCRQAAGEARAGMVPVVVRRTRGVTDVGLWECRVHAFRWVEVSERVSIWVLDLAIHHVDGDPWITATLAEFVAALRRFDVLDGAA